ncbi:MAG: UDP-N-acetyl-D-glucosamine dehydrogenase [Gammaproteobacteria bacterium]|nr:UDP-N-acetyl-D-glucosamine dehydrogenase [Gammaproteobacteria bacterium]
MPNPSKELLNVGVIGLGYVGLPLAMLFLKKNIVTYGFDIDKSKVDMLQNGKSYIGHIDSSEIKDINKDIFKPTTDFSKTSACDALIICVPTPLNNNREPDLSFITATLDLIKPYLRKGQIISLESTTYPGTTKDILVRNIEEEGFTIGQDFYVVYSPEREDPGNKNFNVSNIPKIVSGHTKNCLDKAISVYSLIINNIVPVSSTETAEMAKLLENIYRSINIGLVNEMKILAHTMDIDIYEVINAAATKPFGFNAFYPGPGIGGHCIPVDPFYLTWKAREYGVNTKFIELAGEFNREMPKYVVSRLAYGLNINKKPINGSKVLILGLAYKKNVDDQRESPSIDIMELINEKGGIVDYSDPHIPNFKKMRQHHFKLSSTELSANTISNYDAIILCTDHDIFDYDLIISNSKLVIDTRGVYSTGKYKNTVFKNLVKS